MTRNLSESQIRHKLRSYLDGKTTLHSFCEWFVPATWNLKEKTPTSVRNLVSMVELLMAEHTGGYGTEQDLRARLSERVGVETATATE